MHLPKKLHEKMIFTTPFHSIIETKFLFQNGYEHTYTLWKTQPEDGIFVLPVTKEGMIVSIREYFYGPETYTILTPAGCKEAHLSQEENAKKELLEESGYEAEELIFLGEGIPDKYRKGAFSLYLATGCKKVAEQDLEPGEEISVKLMRIADFEKKIFENEIRYPPIIHGYFLAKPHLQKRGFIS